jgi:hypothetical protein
MLADNYSTASWLNEEANIYRLAAERRFPSPNSSSTIKHYTALIKSHLIDFIKDNFSEYDGDDNGADYTHIHQAIEETVDLGNVEFMGKIVEQLADDDLISKAEVSHWQENYIKSHEENHGRNKVCLKSPTSQMQIIVSTPCIDKIVEAVIVKLLRYEDIPLRLSRDEIMLGSQELSREGSIESSWDNYSTGARLQFRANTYKIAAESRFPRDGDKSVDIIKSKIEEILLHDILFDSSPEHDAESYRIPHSMLKDAIYSVETFEDINLMYELADEFDARGDIRDVSSVREEIRVKHENDAYILKR